MNVLHVHHPHPTRMALILSAITVVGTGLLATQPTHAVPMRFTAQQSEADLTPAEVRSVDEEFADVTRALERQGRDLGSLVAEGEQWLSGVSGNDPGTGKPWTTVFGEQLSEAQSDVSRMRAESTGIGAAIKQALSTLRTGNESRAVRLMQSAAEQLNRLTQDAANSGKNITLTLGTAEALVEKLGNGEGLRRITQSLNLQAGLMRDLRQTESAVPRQLFPNVIPGTVDPEPIAAARRDFRQVTSGLDRQLADLGYLLGHQSEWAKGSDAVDPGTGQPWGSVLGQKVEASRDDVRRIELQADTIAGGLARAFRSARRENEGGFTLALRSAARDLQQLTRDAQGVQTNLLTTLSAVRPLAETVGDQSALMRITGSRQQMLDLLSRLSDVSRVVRTEANRNVR